MICMIKGEYRDINDFYHKFEMYVKRSGECKKW